MNQPRLLLLCALTALGALACDSADEPRPDTTDDTSDSPDTETGGTTRVDVAGRVIDGYGLALASAKVAVRGKSTVTDEDGRFALDDVAAPYDIQVAIAEGFFAIEYQGVTRQDPTLTVPVGTDPTDTAVSGSLAGDVDEDGANRARIIAVGEGFGGDGVRNSTKDWKQFGPLFAKHWKSPAKVRLYALQWNVATPDAISFLPEPTQYLAFGISDPLSLTGSATSASVPLSASAVTGTGQISGAVTLPSGWTLGQKQLAINFAPNASLAFYFDDSPGLAFGVKTPRLGANAGDTTFGLEVAASGPLGESAWAARTGLGASASGVTLAVAPPPTGLSASGPFRWTPSSPASLIAFRPNETNGPGLWVLTAANETTLPDFSAVGITVPAGTSYRFGVAALSGLADVEAATAEGGITDPWVRFTLGMRAEADGGLSFANELVFTTP